MPRFGDQAEDDEHGQGNPDASPGGLRGSEGTFSLCTFVYVDALARAGRTDQARLVLERMLGYTNHLGLHSEEIALTGRQLDDFAQAFTHLALSDATITLDAALNRRRRSARVTHFGGTVRYGSERSGGGRRRRRRAGVALPGR